MKPDINEGVEIGEDKYTWGKEGGSLKDVVLRHIRKLSDISCQELTAGYFDERPMKIGESVSIIKTYHPDLREAFVNGVDFLLTIVQHTISQDTEGDFEKEYEEMQEKEEEEYEKIKKEGFNQDYWIPIKLGLRKKLLKDIMLLLDRIDFFSGADGGIEE